MSSRSPARRASVAELEDDTSWSSFWQAKALFHAAAELLGDPHATRSVGQDVARADLTSETAALLRSLGSPGEVLLHIAQVAPKFCTVVKMEPLEIGSNHALVGATSVEGFPRFPLLCDFTAGLLAQVTIAFDLQPAVVVEEDCEARGAPQCVFRVSWDPEPVAADAEVGAAGLEAELAVLEARLGTLQDTVADLVSADEVAAVLARITARAARTVRAPRYVLVVQPLPESELHIHHEGFEDDRHAEAIAAEVMVDDPDDRGGARLIVDVTSARRSYGRLAAIYDDGLTFFPTEQLQLSAYRALGRRRPRCGHDGRRGAQAGIHCEPRCSIWPALSPTWTVLRSWPSASPRRCRRWWIATPRWSASGTR